MKSKLPHPSRKHIISVVGALLIVYVPIALLSFLFYRSLTRIDSLDMSYEEVRNAQENFQQNLSEELFNEHLALQEKRNLESKLSELEVEIEDLRETPEGSLLSNVNTAYELYGDFEAKVARNQNVELDTEEALTKLETWGVLLIDQDFDALSLEIEEAIKGLDAVYADYVASLPPPPPAASTGYSYTTVTTEKGTHGVHLLKVPLNSVRVKTAASTSDNCKDNCPTKALHEYVNDNGAFAGMNGTYFCPPDYSSCGGKVNSYDYGFYHSSKGKWINKDALGWSATGLFTFKGNSYDFYKKSTEYGGGSVDAGISNYPSLVKNSEVIIKDGDLTSYQKIRGTRGAIGAGGENLYLAVIYNATVEEAAYVMRALGTKHALNLDGGGSTAMYVDGRYVVGPGRSLPNAILLVR